MRIRLLLFALVLLAASGPALSSSLVGYWELVRVDGVSPRDIPPYGFHNLQIQFRADGKVLHWSPGRPDDARDAPYLLSGGNLRAWIGLSNDFDTPRPIAFFGKSWFEIELPDGFTGLFQRLDSPAESPRCIFFTIAGENFDEEDAKARKQALFSFESQPLPPQLLGKWQHTARSESEGGWSSTLEIAEGGASLATRSLDYPSIPPEVQSGPIEIDGGYLRSPALFCGAVCSFEITDSGRLVVRPDLSNSIAFERQRE